ncbi:MAG: hypothetical protein V7735_03975 [Photobacterium frigidiphilum]|uniref:hypothetical protein n=1 Tax=Photobacterium frigidiphilum TaxID=264736 RepID=UPI003002EDD6
MALYQTVLVAAVVGFCSDFGTGVAMKTGIKWMREMITKMDARLTRLEQKNKATGWQWLYS